MSFGRQFRRRHRPRCAVCGELADGFLLELPLCLECRDSLELEVHLVSPEEAERISETGGCGCPGCAGVVRIHAADLDDAS